MTVVHTDSFDLCKMVLYLSHRKISDIDEINAANASETFRFEAPTVGQNMYGAIRISDLN